MTILLEPPKLDSPTFEIDHQIALALATLYHALVKIRGAGRFGGHAASIVLERETDTDVAVAALDKVGIHVVISDTAQSQLHR
jgi:hypothetical protein